MGQYRTLAEYITTRAREMGHNTLSLSEALNFGRSYINAVINGQFLPSQHRCRKIAQYFGDNPATILTLAGYQEPPPQGETLDEVARLVGSLPEDQQRQIRDYAAFLKTQSQSSPESNPPE